MTKNRIERCRALAIAIVSSAMFGCTLPLASADVLIPNNVFMSEYNQPLLNGVVQTENRENAFTVLTNGIISRTSSDRIDTRNNDNHVGGNPVGNTFDFVGLQYASVNQFDKITIELGTALSTGGNWESTPYVYILKNLNLVGDTVEPNMSPNWLQLNPANILIDGPAFSQTVGATGTLVFDLAGVAVADRIGWGWAVGGVDGNGTSNSVSFTEVYAEGTASAQMPIIPQPATPTPVQVIANVYNSIGRNGDGLDPNRGQAFASVNNGLLDSNVGLANDGFDTCCGPLTDFVGLQYGVVNRFDTITVHLGNQFIDGGDWDSMPRIFILKNPVDTNQTRPETDTANWREITGAVETTGHVFTPVTIGPNVAGGTLIFDLSAIPEYERTGWGWAVGGVDGNSLPSGATQNFVSVTELSANGALVPGPAAMKLEVYAHGEVRLINQTGMYLPIDFYQVTSAGNALNLAGWNSLGDGAANPGTHSSAEFPIGSGVGDGWEEMFNLHAGLVAEAYFEASSTLDSGQFVSLGNLFAGPEKDLAFRYRLANGEIVDGVVEYLGLPGDFNDDGVVNAADYVVWRDNLNGSANLPNDPTQGTVTDGDYGVWKSNFGHESVADSGSGNSASIPEPQSIGLLVIALGVVLALRGKRFASGLSLSIALLMAGSSHGQSLTTDPVIQANFSHLSLIGTGIGNVTQMAFGPDGKLYVATFTNGVKRFDYDDSGNLTNGITVWSRPASGNYLNGSLGLAFHEDPTLGTVMYIAPSVSFGANPTINLIQPIIRLTDNNGDGTWGGAGEVNQAIVDNLRITDLHQVNQMQIRGDTLYVAIGSRTRTGGNVSEYGGAANPDDGEFAYTGAINWIRDLTQLSNDTTTINLAGHTITQHHTDTQAFTSTDTGKLTVYSTGFRNPYGIAFDGEGQLWATMNQNENPLLPDELHRTDFQVDHKFPKINEVSGNWKTNATALAEGFFQTFRDPVALLGNHASADGIAFTNHTPVLEGHPFIVRYATGDDLVMVDPNTGLVRQVIAGLNNPLAVLTDPNGHLLIGQHGNTGRIYRAWLVNPDLNDDDVVNYLDWHRIRDNFNQTHIDMTVLQARSVGDLNGDFKTDFLDYHEFKQAYEGMFGAGSFARLLNVPEPGMQALLGIAIVGLLSYRSRMAYSASKVRR